MSYEKYDHHGKEVWVRSDLKGKHKDFCLCHSCENLNLDVADRNCPIAQTLFKYDKLYKIVTPVWECPDFIQKDENIDGK